MRIHPFPARPRLLAVVMTLATLLLLLVPLAAYAQANTAHGFYQQTNLVSDLPNIATFQDPNLLNPWGLSHGPTTPWWVSENGLAGPSLFMFATEDGTISGWNRTVDVTHAIREVDRSTVGAGAVYKGLAIASLASGTFIYATN